MADNTMKLCSDAWGYIYVERKIGGEVSKVYFTPLQIQRLTAFAADAQKALAKQDAPDDRNDW